MPANTLRWTTDARRRDGGVGGRGESREQPPGLLTGEHDGVPPRAWDRPQRRAATPGGHEERPRTIGEHDGEGALVDVGRHAPSDVVHVGAHGALQRQRRPRTSAAPVPNADSRVSTARSRVGGIAVAGDEAIEARHRLQVDLAAPRGSSGARTPHVTGAGAVR